MLSKIYIFLKTFRIFQQVCWPVVQSMECGFVKETSWVRDLKQQVGARSVSRSPFCWKSKTQTELDKQIAAPPSACVQWMACVWTPGPVLTTDIYKLPSKQPARCF